VIFLVLGDLTSVLCMVTIITAFMFPYVPSFLGNIFLKICMGLCSGAYIILCLMFRQGGSKPKIKNLQYYFVFQIIV
uniref:Uncharacterized protein n=1 Tax=Xenopus tropicalis TaxID=8364 RepID=A0A6I8RU88_XENTR